MVLCQKAKIDNQGRVAIPKDMLTEAGLSPGDYLYIQVDEESQELIVTAGRKSSGLTEQWVKEWFDKNCQIHTRIE